ncbi:MAG: hypothetical protein V4671_30270 [Armatimonadota bacterium]
MDDSLSKVSESVARTDRTAAITAAERSQLLDLSRRFRDASRTGRQSLAERAAAITGERSRADDSAPASVVTASFMWDARHDGDDESAVSAMLEFFRLGAGTNDNANASP